MKAPVSNREWIHWGEQDPLFGVLTLPGHDRSGTTPWTPERVRANGENYFRSVREQWTQYGVGREHCVEIGCGSGRITGPLTTLFERVTAIDVSPDQLLVASSMLGDRGRSVDFRLVSEPSIPLPDQTCDGVFSCEVFQHFDPMETAITYVREAARVLRPGGTLCVQIPVRGINNTGFLGSSLRQSILGLARRLGRRRMMTYRAYSAEFIFAALHEAGFTRRELRFFATGEHEGYHGYYFATR
jgi:SAM-dependent methyltransferase